MFYAHSLLDAPESNWQTLDDHHAGVARLATAFAVFGAPRTAELLGAIHDTGKRSDSFQRRLRGKAGKVDHTSAAYAYLLREWGRGDQPKKGQCIARLLAYPLLGHHGGLPDCGSAAEPGTLENRLSGPRLANIPDWKPDAMPPLSGAMDFLQELAPLMCLEGKRPDAFAVSFVLRMLHSCLVDADFLDTERFCAPSKYALRPAWPTIPQLDTALREHLVRRGFLSDAPVPEAALATGGDVPCGSPERLAAIRQARLFMLQRCLAAADETPGVFSLTMPTGGGKTLSSLAFALRHARKHGLRRIILVVPYTSIIEQNAEIFRQALGQDAVLEHHSSFVHPDEQAEDDSAAQAYKLSTENWDATVIVTTSVQFFESLFDNRPSRCRKLHNIARSVVIFDEIQLLPVPYVQPCLAALKLLARHYGCSLVLCTATQPALMKSPFLQDGFDPRDVRHIIPPSAMFALFRIFERVRVEKADALRSDDDLADFIRAQEQVLCIVNSRKQARELFDRLDGGEADFHLSARMTPHHRSQTLDIIRKRLSQGLPCRVVSTSLIECGVDISFPVVLREKNGLDVLAQAAGRCNREGTRAQGRVLYFSYASVPQKAAELNRRRSAFDAVSEHEGLFSPQTVQAYFEALYKNSPSLDEKEILQRMRDENRSMPLPSVFNFATMARDFRFIEEETENIIIEKDDAAELLAQCLEHGPIPPAVLRTLQRFSVQVRRYELERMIRDGRIETRCGFLHVLSGGIGYDDKKGLDVTSGYEVAVDDLVF